MNNSLMIRNAITLVGIILLLIGCGKDATEPEPRQPTSTFPLSEGSRWEYQGILYLVPFNDTSLADTVVKEIYRHIIGPDTALPVQGLVLCDDTVITNVGGLLDTFITSRWLKIDDNKLKLYSKSERPIGNDPVPILYNPPHVLMDFPLNAGKSWLASSLDFITEYRTVAGIEYIEIPMGWLNCDVLRADILDLPEDTLRSAYDWYSDDGLMRFEADHGVDIIEDENGVFLDSVRTLELWELVEMDIRP